MPNLHIAVLATKDKHDEIVRDINKWQYEIEGEQAKGTFAPFISELKFYEVRVPPEIEEQFARDMGVSGYGMFGVSRSPMLRLFWLLYKFALFFTPYRSIKVAKGERQFKFPVGWSYVVPIGALKRKKMPVKFGKDREVL